MRDHAASHSCLSTSSVSVRANALKHIISHSNTPLPITPILRTKKITLSRTDSHGHVATQNFISDNERLYSLANDLYDCTAKTKLAIDSIDEYGALRIAHDCFVKFS